MHTFGDERIAASNGIEIAYQEMGSPDGEPLLLVMGVATQMIAWDEGFCSLLVDRGFRVVRFDNRDIGHSTKFSAAGVPSRFDMLVGKRATAPYLLRDMAGDTVGLMDHLGIEAAHVVGASMGGMIAQSVAIEHPDRLLSLTSIMSTTGSRWVGMPSLTALRVILGKPPTSREEVVERAVKVFKVIGSPGFPFEEDYVREIAGRSYDRSYDATGMARQGHAITASGDRTRALRGVRTPTLVIHGAGDPLVRPAGGRATARAIPGARLEMIDGMGHDLPRQLWPLFADQIAANAARASKGAGAAKQPA
jgi:pimeloyl-ACP methyl ester carboxylesterase